MLSNLEDRKTLYSLIRSSLGTSVEATYSLEQIHNAMLLGRQQGVSSVVFDGFQKCKEECSNISPDDLSRLKAKWLMDLGQAINSHQIIHQAEELINERLKKGGINALVLKGSAFASFYDVPEIRQFGDIDIYSPTEFEAIDAILKEIGKNHELECYRHTHCTVNGITVENHIYLTDARWKKKWMPLEEFLSKEAAGYLETKQEPGLCYPDPLFSIVFYLYHTLAHLVYEHINVRFLLDWYYLMKKSSDVDEDILKEKLAEFGLLRIAGVVTYLCVERLGMDNGSVPSFIMEESEKVPSALIKRIEDDMFDTNHEGFTTNSLKDRVKRIQKYYQNRWKIEQLLDVSYLQFIWEKVSSICKWKGE